MGGILRQLGHVELRMSVQNYDRYPGTLAGIDIGLLQVAEQHFNGAANFTRNVLQNIGVNYIPTIRQIWAAHGQSVNGIARVNTVYEAIGSHAVDHDSRAQEMYEDARYWLRDSRDPVALVTNDATAGRHEVYMCRRIQALIWGSRVAIDSYVSSFMHPELEAALLRVESLYSSSSLFDTSYAARDSILRAP